MELKVEIAQTPDQLTRGLMYRESLPSDHGMLFKFENSLQPAFWGKDTYIPLDIAFVGMDGRIADIKHIAPMATKIIHSGSICSMAIEANAGYFQSNNIGPGTKVIIDDQKGSVSFQNA